ncbi:SNARE [Hexamita inflata]|uniref:SNARE n=1 Tax=Hexamita inflata TaxID=28002 RepID=A0AA86NT32_9EUKA|nr:SNARE [Hexamita inflata]CAI9929001.1 SNARE [Hexamita inflata]
MDKSVKYQPIGAPTAVSTSSMEDFTDALQDLDSIIKTANQFLQGQKLTPQVENQIKKATTALNSTRQELNKLKGLEKQQCQDKLKQREQSVKKLEQDFERLKQSSQQTQLSSDLQSKEQQLAGRLQQGNAYLTDTVRTGQEAQQSGYNVVQSLASQNKQMQSIGAKTTNIEMNSKKSEQLLNEMKRKEKGVNILLYLLCLALLASDGGAFYLYHKPSNK